MTTKTGESTRHAGPLQGIRVVELSTTLLGPYCGQLLAEMGADVIKVESPDGDVNRHLIAGRSAGMSPQFLNFNAGKRSLALDLKDPQGLAALLALLASADVFLHNSRPAAIERLGLGPDRVRAVRPDIVYCCLTGFASGSAEAGRPAYDDVIQAISGMAHLQGYSRSEPDFVVSALCDKAVGLAGVAAINAALVHRAVTGQGDTIEVPMYDFMAGFVLQEQLGARTFEPPLGPIGYPRTLSPNRRPYRAADGYLSVVAITDAQWVSLANAVGHPEILHVPTETDPGCAPRDVEAAMAVIERVLASRTVAEWTEILDRVGVPTTPVRTIDEVANDPELARRGVVERVDHPSEGQLLRVRQATSFARHSRGDLLPAPGLGQHNEELLLEAGLTPEEVSALTDRSTIKKRMEVS